MRLTDPVQHAHQKERIVTCAGSLFARHGFRATSMDRIASACRIKKPSLYHYFESKQAILRGLIQTRVRQTQARVSKVVQQPDMETALFELGHAFLVSMRAKGTRDYMLLLLRDSINDAHLRKLLVEESRNKVDELCGALPHHPYPGFDRQRFTMAMHQFMGSLLRFAVETLIWKYGPAMDFSADAYVRLLARTYTRGLQD